MTNVWSVLRVRDETTTAVRFIHANRTDGDPSSDFKSPQLLRQFLLLTGVLISLFIGTAKARSDIRV